MLVLGVVAGFMNTVAGGGSALTVPALMLVGLPVELANGTNRVAVVAQSVAGAHGLASHEQMDAGQVRAVVVPTSVGGLLGAVAAARMPPMVLEPLLLGLLVGMAALLAFRPDALVPPAGTEPRSVDVRSGAALFAVGLYGGFAQAGSGFLLLAVLGGLLRHELVRANALKLVCVAVFAFGALVIFAAAGQVDWASGAILAVSTVIGARLGVRFAVRADTRWLRGLLLLAVVLAVGLAWLR